MTAPQNLDGAELAQLAKRIACLSQQLEGSATKATWSLGSFLGGMLLACAVVALAW